MIKHVHDCYFFDLPSTFAEILESDRSTFCHIDALKSRGYKYGCINLEDSLLLKNKD